MKLGLCQSCGKIATQACSICGATVCIACNGKLGCKVCKGIKKV